MRRFIWFITGALIVVWSLVAWAAHALLGAGGSLIAGNADMLPAEPEAIEWFSWAAQLGTGIGEWLVVAIWAVVSLVILAIGFVLTRFTSHASSGSV